MSDLSKLPNYDEYRPAKGLNQTGFDPNIF